MARLNWVTSTPSSKQRPLAKTVVYVRIKAEPAMPWTKLNEVAAPGNSLELTDQQPGDWEWGFDEVDTDGKTSPLDKRFVVLGRVEFAGPTGVVSATFTP